MTKYIVKRVLLMIPTLINPVPPMMRTCMAFTIAIS